jgi:hypothetical protein
MSSTRSDSVDEPLAPKRQALDEALEQEAARMRQLEKLRRDAMGHDVAEQEAARMQGFEEARRDVMGQGLPDGE